LVFKVAHRDILNSFIRSRWQTIRSLSLTSIMTKCQLSSHC